MIGGQLDCELRRYMIAYLEILGYVGIDYQVLCGNTLVQ